MRLNCLHCKITSTETLLSESRNNITGSLYSQLITVISVSAVELIYVKDRCDVTAKLPHLGNAHL
jgi:hypothetical protein